MDAVKDGCEIARLDDHGGHGGQAVHACRSKCGGPGRTGIKTRGVILRTVEEGMFGHDAFIEGVRLCLILRSTRLRLILLHLLRRPSISRFGIGVRRRARAASASSGCPPRPHRICAAFIPRLVYRREVLSVRHPRAKDTQRGAEEHVEAVVAGVHDAGEAHARGG